MTRESEKVRRWSESLIEKRLAPEEFVELKAAILKNDLLMEEYVDGIFTHASLELLARDEPYDSEAIRPFLQARTFAYDGRDDISSDKKVAPAGFSSTFAAVAVFCLVSLAFVMTVEAVVFLRSARSEEPRFATIVQTLNCLWSDSSAPIRPGARLGRSFLRLEQGVAVLRFDSGVTVSLEGPCEFEIKKERLCFLHAGRMVVTVETPKGGEFTIETHDATVKDFSTEFGIDTRIDGPTHLFVIDGYVEVVPRTSGRVLTVRRGESLALEAGNASDTVPDPIATEMFPVSTATGRGAAAWAIRDESALEYVRKFYPNAVTEPYMLVKNSAADEAVSDRKALFRIDLSEIDEKILAEFDDVVLCFSYGPTEAGFVSNTPDTMFTVYGLIDESCDDWDAKTLDWANFPGNDDRNRLRPASWTPLGRFRIEQGSRTGTVRIEGKSIREFLRRDTNRLVSFAIVSDTVGGTSSLVFGFANNRHKELTPPRLFFKIEERTTSSAPNAGLFQANRDGNAVALLTD